MIADFLSNNTSWAKGRSKFVIEKSIKNSLCFGVFDQDNNQLGFARVITDFAVFAWILDVFILEEYRGNGLGKLLIEKIISHEELQGLRRFGLRTDDAHELYKKFGFTSLSEPDLMMEKLSIQNS